MKSQLFPLAAIFRFPSGQKHIDLSRKGLDLGNFDFSVLKETESLDLSACGLTQLPKGVEHMPKLKRLKLSANRQLKMSNVLYRLAESKSLRELDIANNAIKTLPAEIYHLRSLKRLVLDHNPIEVVSAFNLLNLPEAIESLSCYGCLFEEISNTIKLLPRLKTLELDHDIYDDLVRINLYNPNVHLMVA